MNLEQNAHLAISTKNICPFALANEDGLPNTIFPNFVFFPPDITV